MARFGQSRSLEYERPNDVEMLILANSSLPPMPFDDRVAAAAASGFDAIGLSTKEYIRLQREGATVSDMRASLARHGIRLAELTVLIGFAVQEDGSVRPPSLGRLDPSADSEARLFEMASAFGARHLQALGTFGSGELEERAVEAFARVCDRAAEYGLLVSLEFVPGTNIPDARVARQVVRAAGRSNGGICVDSWHHFRGADDEQLLRDLAPEDVALIQLTDGPASPVDPDYLTDTLSHRLPPGDGDFDLVRFLDVLWSNGIRAPISVEVMSTELARKQPSQVAAELGAAARSVIDAARA